MLLRVSQLNVRAPDQRTLLAAVSLELQPHEITVIIGPSGAGKTTLLRALLEPDALRADGFDVSHDPDALLESLGLVPQLGGLFDHLDVAGNIELALRRSGPWSSNSTEAIAHWLRVVDLDERWATSGRSVAHLSGGQAQRLAVSRSLASGRRVLFLDEPTRGLDPIRVHRLADCLRQICNRGNAAMVVVTHDTQFAAELADRVYLLADEGLHPIPVAPRADEGCRDPGLARLLRDWLEEHLRRSIEASESLRADPDHGAPRPRSFSPFRGVEGHLRPFEILAQVPQSLVASVQHPRDFAHVLRFALVQSLLRPWLFYGVVSFLLGFTILYVLTTLGSALGAAGSVRYLRGLHVVALTPPLTAFLFVAASANTVNAWLGGMRLSRQTAALEALGIPRSSYLWAPLWVALTLAFVIVAATFALGLVVGGVALCSVEGIDHGWELLTSDLLDPVPARAPYVVRAVALCFIYAVGCASDAIARGDGPKETADDVTRAMTRSVISCTLWVAVLELVSLVLVRLARGTP